MHALEFTLIAIAQRLRQTGHDDVAADIEALASASHIWAAVDCKGKVIGDNIKDTPIHKRYLKRFYRK